MKQTQIFRSIQEWKDFRKSKELSGKSLGFVPTMGALHAGHCTLFQRCVSENDASLVSIFVNPTQFDEKKDLENYPQTFDADLKKLKENGVQYLLYPDFNELYTDRYRYRISENSVSRDLCGAHRPGHFEGVLTVVMKLLQIAGADRAYFGEKDYQQYLLVRGMAEAFFLNTEIVGCETVRENDGLAMSSRNALLNPTYRELARVFPRVLGSNASIAEMKLELEHQGFQVDYIEEKFGRRLGAVRLGQVRLIDNVPIK